VSKNAANISYFSAVVCWHNNHYCITCNLGHQLCRFPSIAVAYATHHWHPSAGWFPPEMWVKTIFPFALAEGIYRYRMYCTAVYSVRRKGEKCLRPKRWSCWHEECHVIWAYSVETTAIFILLENVRERCKRPIPRQNR
jgi:hypothetical protein